MAKRKVKIDVTAHFKMIGRICWKYWQRLPVAARAHIDVTDLMGEVCLRLVESAKYFDAERGAESTFVCRVAENHCRVVVNRYHLKKRRAAVYSMTDQEKSPAFLRPDDAVDWVLARQPVERVLADASDGLRRSFAHFLQYRQPRRFTTDNLEEFRTLASKHGLHYFDLRLVLNGC
jgi:DNA-directed RNA polymerase specialized sigma24 family protein